MSETGHNKDAARESLLWWRHPFFRLRWKQWHIKWLELADEPEANDPGGFEDVLVRLKEAGCDPDVALRLAFLEASQKPATKSELAGDNKRQQRVKRKLTQSRNHLWKAMALGLERAAQSEFAKSDTRQRRITRKVGQVRNHILKVTLELEQALSEISLIFIKPEDVEALKAMADVTDTQRVISLRNLAQMCDHEIEALNWSRAVELPPGHELFTLVSYLTACSGEPHFPLVTDLLAVAHQAYDLMLPATDSSTEPPTQDAIEKQVQRFRKLKLESGEDSILPEVIAEFTAQRAKSGELRRELLGCYPDQSLQ
ncbi:MAG TPA: hypothetical protein VIX37_17230 [Candidatus Sulfotelmatobacter sp.]